MLVSGIQEINNTFLVAELSLEPHLTGIKVKGRIVNSSSLSHENVKFKITVSKQSQEFTLNRVSPGSSTSFEVYVPDVPIKDTRSGEIEYIESMVSYNIN